jgi:hypothetical protein
MEIRPMPDCSRSGVVHAILTAAEWELIQEIRRIDRHEGCSPDLAAELRKRWPVEPPILRFSPGSPGHPDPSWRRD